MLEIHALQPSLPLMARHAYSISYLTRTPWQLAIAIVDISASSRHAHNEHVVWSLR